MYPEELRTSKRNYLVRYAYQVEEHMEKDKTLTKKDACAKVGCTTAEYQRGKRIRDNRKAKNNYYWP